ncbi:unnamed protein product, partial [Anisakis simplex]|uniref:CC domain-containing protein n=1 Tax=Anisakis simplex TaxID=6269 RepID=A0A0M3KHW7_ANISI
MSLDLGNLCPTGHVCYPNSTAPNAMCYQSCGGTGTPVGGSINGLCPAGSILTFGECCRRNSYREAFFGTPLYDYTPSVMKANVLGTCMNGSPIISGCIKGVCGAGLDCINDVCCASNRNSQNAIAFSPQSTRPIGVKCEMPQQCVGFNEGLSTCDMGRCKCQPYAYTQGMACARRKSFSQSFF